TGDEEGGAAPSTAVQVRLPVPTDETVRADQHLAFPPHPALPQLTTARGVLRTRPAQAAGHEVSFGSVSVEFDKRLAVVVQIAAPGDRVDDPPAHHALGVDQEAAA